MAPNFFNFTGFVVTVLLGKPLKGFKTLPVSYAHPVFAYRDLNFMALICPMIQCELWDIHGCVPISVQSV